METCRDRRLPPTQRSIFQIRKVWPQARTLRSQRRRLQNQIPIGSLPKVPRHRNESALTQHHARNLSQVSFFNIFRQISLTLYQKMRLLVSKLMKACLFSSCNGNFLFLVLAGHSSTRGRHHTDDIAPVTEPGNVNTGQVRYLATNMEGSDHGS